jgi:alpha-mannosidase
VVVYNPVARQRQDVVTAELEFATLPASVTVFDKNGKEVPSQIIEKNGTKLKFMFLATLPSAGMAVYDVRESAATQPASGLIVTTNSLENAYYKVKVAANGDILSIFDKKASKELLAKPARLEFLKEEPHEWPAWNMDWKDRQKPAVDFMDKDAVVSIAEQGPVRVTLKVQRKGQNSEIVQYYSLSAGEAGKRLEVSNKIDWQSREVCLKASFPLAVSNEKATYNLGVGTIARGNNDEKKFEVPSKEWFDLTDKSGKYGVTILEDCKFGSDKPDDNTLRLTLLYTPKATGQGSWFVYQSTQDWGIHDVKYAVYGHSGDWAKAESPWQAKFFNQPLVAFEAPKHAGEMGQSFSMISINNPQVGLMALKKMENAGYYVVRVNELSGKDQKGIKLSFGAAVAEAFEVDGQERKIGAATVANGQLHFDLSHYTIRSFAVKLKPAAAQVAPAQAYVALPFNTDVISSDSNRGDGNLNSGQSIPAELLPAVVQSEDIRFEIGNKADEQKNALSCDGQTIDLPAGKYTKLYLLAAANNDTKADFEVDGQPTTLTIQKWTGYVGQHYNRILSRDQNSVVEMEKPFAKTANIAWFASHCHNDYPLKNEAYQYCYLYKYEIAIPAGAKTITLPKEGKIKVLGMTVAQKATDDLKPLQPLYDDFKDNAGFVLR